MAKKKRRKKATTQPHREGEPRYPLGRKVRTYENEWGKGETITEYRRLATRGETSWEYPRGQASKLLQSFQETADEWFTIAKPGDRILWYSELFLLNGWGGGGEGIRLVRGEEEIAEYRTAIYN